MSDDKAKAIIESLMPLQRKGELFPCPRCGKHRMDPVAHRNALSRYANVYICSWCGVEEAMYDFCHQSPLPFKEWATAHWD